MITELDFEAEALVVDFNGLSMYLGKLNLTYFFSLMSYN